MELPAYHFAGNIVVEEGKEFMQDYLQFPFEVPPGVGALRLRLQYDPLVVGPISNLITLGLFDPDGFRGNAHRHPPDPEVILSPGTATPGFIPGPIQAGRWLAQLAIQMVLADTRPCTYSLDIELLQAAETQNAVHRRMPSRQLAAGRAGWFRGELHSHTFHSDGALSMDELIAQAQAQHFDFLAITDHNTTSALGEAESAALDGLLLIPGIELTTFSGHALALGVNRWVDWRTGYHGWTMEDAARLTRASGGLFIIAHPNDIGNPTCTGCKWDYLDFDLDLVDAIEIWNGAWFNENGGNPKNLPMWQSLQGDLRRIPATAGCDYHKIGNWGEGLPVTYVYARSLTVPDVLEGIRQGRVIISSGPWLGLQAAPDEVSTPGGIGDTVYTGSRRAYLTAGWEKVPPESHLAVRSRGGELLSERIAGAGSGSYWIDLQADDRLWLELYSADGSLIALTNPVFVKARP